MEKRLVLVHPLSFSEADACVSRVHVDCVAAGAPRRHIPLITHHPPAYPHELCLEYDSEGARRPRLKTGGSSSPLETHAAKL